MPEAHLYMAKQANDIDGSVKQRAFTFLTKLTSDDAAPGLHIEPIHGAADPRVRTGRVDDKYRAVLFKVDGRPPTYVLYGIWNHEEAIRQAKITKFRMNPVNGVVETTQEEAASAAAEVGPAVGPTSVPAPTPVEAPAKPTAEPPAQPVAPASPVPSPVPSPSPVPPSRAVPPARAVPEPAQPLLSVSAEDLKQLGIPEALAGRVVGVSDDVEFNRLVDGAPPWQSEALLSLATGSSLDQVREELELSTSEAEDEVQAERSDDEKLLEALGKPASRMQFAEIDGVEELRRVIEEGDFGAWRVFLHPVQRAWVQKDWKGPFRLAGGAGTGKTVVAVHRARRLARARADERIVLTTFTRNLSDELASSLKRLDPGVPQVGLGEQGVHVSGIDALASAVIRRADPGQLSAAVAKVLGAGRSDVGGGVDNRLWGSVAKEVPELPEKLRNPRFLESEYEMVVLPNGIVDEAGYLRVRRPGRGVRLNRGARMAVWKAVARYREEEALHGCADFAEKAAIAAAYLDFVVADQGHLADHVLVDEGQDLGPTRWMLVRALVGQRANDIFLAEDGHQRIYGQRLVLSHYGIATRGRSRKLTLNYRTTAENLRWATALLQGVSYEDLEGDDDTVDGYRSARHGVEPVVRRCSGLVEELDVTARTLQDWIAAGQRSGRSEALAVLVRDKQQRDRVVSGLNERGVPAVSVDRGGAGGITDPVVMTMHRAKGTEFTKVVLFDVDVNRASAVHGYDFSEEDEAEAQKRERSLLYVAASRARDELVLTLT